MNGNLAHKQRGMTMIAWLFIIAFLGFQGMIAMKIAPIYFNDASLKAMLKDMEADASLPGQSPRALSETLFKRLRVNGIYSLTKDNVKIKKTRTHYVLIVQYEPRGNIAGSLDYIMTFRHEAKIPIGR